MDGDPGIEGGDLGGSRAIRTHSADFDIDIGFYYDESKEFNINDIENIAFNLNDEKRSI